MHHKYKINKTKAVIVKRGLKMISPYLSKTHISQLKDIIEQAQYKSVSITESNLKTLEWAEKSSDIQL